MDNENAFVPIYKQLLEKYKEDIISGRLSPGDRIDSISTIQKKHSVARETAKRVLSLLAKEGYIFQLRGKGSFVADLGPKKKVWGLVFPFYSIQYEDLINELYHRASEVGREVHAFCDYNNCEEEIRIVERMLKERYEAVAVIPTLDESRTWSFYSDLLPHYPKLVLLDHTMTSNDFSFVVQSYDLGVARAINYLLSRQSGGVAFIENEVWAGRNMVLELMRWTYMELMRTRRPDHEIVILPRANMVNANEFREKNITGIFCCDDTSAIQTIGRLKSQGAAIPGEFHIVSYGNTDLSRFFTPAISSVDPHNAEMAAILTDFLKDPLSDNPERKLQHVISPELVLRDT